MEVTETEHFFGTALAIQEINQSGGIRGREIEVVAYDPGSDPETYRKLADRLLTEDRHLGHFRLQYFGCTQGHPAGH